MGSTIQHTLLTPMILSYRLVNSLKQTISLRWRCWCWSLGISRNILAIWKGPYAPI